MGCKLLIGALFVTIFAGCGPTKSASELVFTKNVYFCHPKIDSPAEFDIPFTVGTSAPVTIDHIERSCSCTTIGQGIVDVALHSGREYQLPIRVSTSGKDAFSEEVKLVTKTGFVASFTIAGIVNSRPQVPSLVNCDLNQNGKCASGEFEVRRIRLSSEPPLVPQVPIQVANAVRINLVNSEQVAYNRGNWAMIDIQKWNWEIVKTPGAIKKESIEIVWKDDQCSPTRIDFEFHTSSSRSVPTDFFCGKVKPGQAIKGRIPVDANEWDKLGGISEVEPDDGIEVTFERRNVMVYMNVTIEPQRGTGKVERYIRARLCPNGENPTAIRVWAVVAD